MHVWTEGTVRSVHLNFAAHTETRNQDSETSVANGPVGRSQRKDDHSETELHGRSEIQKEMEI